MFSFCLVFSLSVFECGLYIYVVNKLFIIYVLFEVFFFFYNLKLILQYVEEENLHNMNTDNSIACAIVIYLHAS